MGFGSIEFSDRLRGSAALVIMIVGTLAVILLIYQSRTDLASLGLMFVGFLGILVLAALFARRRVS